MDCDAAPARKGSLTGMPRLTRDSTTRTVFRMKTTLNIDDGVMRQLKAAAAQRQTTMSALVEAAIRRILAEPLQGDVHSQSRARLPTWRSGGFRVDIADRDALYRALEEQ